MKNQWNESNQINFNQWNESINQKLKVDTAFLSNLNQIIKIGHLPLSSISEFFAIASNDYRHFLAKKKSKRWVRGISSHVTRDMVKI